MIALQAVEAGIEGKARAFERTIMSRRSRENSIDEKRRIRNERNKRKRLSRIMEREAKKIENRKKETRIRVLNNWLLFTMPNGRNLSNRIKEERWTEPRYDLNFVNSANHSI